MTMSAAEIKKHQEKQAKERGGSKVPWLNIERGDCLVRIGPPWKENGEFWRDSFFHGGYKDKVYCAKNDVDPKTGKPRKCLICKRVEELKNDRSPFGKKLWAILHQQSAGLWNAALVEKTESGNKYAARKYVDSQFKVLRLSNKWHNLLMDIFADDELREKSILGPADPKVGRLIKVTRIGKDTDTEYKFKASSSVTPILADRDKRKALQKTIIDLDRIATGSTDEELQAFLHRAEKQAKREAKHEEHKHHHHSSSGSSSGSSSKSASKSSSGSKSTSASGSGSSSASSSPSASASASSSTSASGDLEEKYKEMKKEIKNESKSNSKSASASSSKSASAS